MIALIVDLITSLGKFIYEIGRLIVQTITGIFQLIAMLPNYVSYVADVISILPSWLTVFSVGILTISVIWAIRKAV